MALRTLTVQPTVVKSAATHAASVTTLAWHPTSAGVAASGDASGDVRLWDTRAKRSYLQLGLEHGATTSKFSPDGRLLLTGSKHGSVQLWDLSKGAAAATWAVGSAAITDAAFHPRDFFFAVSSRDGRVALFDVVSHTLLGTSPAQAGQPVHSIEFLADGSHILAACSNAIKVWSWQAGSIGANSRPSSARLELAAREQLPCQEFHDMWYGQVRSSSGDKQPHAVVVDSRGPALRAWGVDVAKLPPFAATPASSPELGESKSGEPAPAAAAAAAAAAVRSSLSAAHHGEHPHTGRAGSAQGSPCARDAPGAAVVASSGHAGRSAHADSKHSPDHAGYDDDAAPAPASQHSDDDGGASGSGAQSISASDDDDDNDDDSDEDALVMPFAAHPSIAGLPLPGEQPKLVPSMFDRPLGLDFSAFLPRPASNLAATAVVSSLGERVGSAAVRRYEARVQAQARVGSARSRRARQAPPEPAAAHKAALAATSKATRAAAAPSSHAEMLQSRLQALTPLCEQWHAGDTKGWALSLGACPDHAAAADVLRTIKWRRTGLGLESVPLLTPILVELLQRGYAEYVAVAARTLGVLLKAFAPVIRTSLARAVRLGVDVAAEGRRERAEAAKAALLNAVQAAQRADSQGDRDANDALQQLAALARQL